VSLQPFSAGRQVVVERHGRDQGPRKEWHGGSGSQGSGFADNRRMGGSRGRTMAPSRYATLTESDDITPRMTPSSRPSYIWSSFPFVQSLLVRNEPDCTDHQQLRPQWRRRQRGVQALQRNAAAVLAASKFGHFKPPENVKTVLNLFLEYQLFIGGTFVAMSLITHFYFV